MGMILGFTPYTSTKAAEIVHLSEKRIVMRISASENRE
jgi:hypothetical protein